MKATAMGNLKQDNTSSLVPTGLTVTSASREDGLAANESRFQPGIDSSEAAAILGLDPVRTSLDIWHQKRGLLTQPEVGLDQDEGRVSWQFILEPLVAAVYSKRTGNPIKRVSKTQRHPAYPWMGAAIRWEVGSPEVQLLHCLRVHSKDIPLWQKGVPEHVRIDLLHLLAVSGKQAVDLAVLEGGKSVRILRVERDEALIERLIEAEAQFWGYVERGRVPA